MVQWLGSKLGQKEGSKLGTKHGTDEFGVEDGYRLRSLLGVKLRIDFGLDAFSDGSRLSNSLSTKLGSPEGYKLGI